MKTEATWHEDGRNLCEYLKPGDVVDESMAMYFLEVVPPVTQASDLIQMGEPYSHDEYNRARYATLQRKAGKWTYTGHQNRGVRVYSDGPL